MRTLVASVFVFGVAALLLVRAGPRQPPVQADALPTALVGMPDGRAERLGRALSFRTVSEEGGQGDPAAFADLRAFLEVSFPAVHRTLAWEMVGGGALLYRWEGRDEDAAPFLLMAHYDVVPVEPGTERRWTYPPFEGVVADGAVWGRGAMDDKASVLGILEAVEGLLTQGFRPTRTTYLVFGHDEETGGRDGAARVARLLAERGVHPEFVLDEGLVIADRFLPGVDRPVALIGIAEKGFLSVELAIQTIGGHSSVSPRNTAVGVIAAAVARLEALAPELTIGRRLVLRNLWLFGAVVRSRLAAIPETDAAIRTTTAVTSFEGGSSPNMLPAASRAVVNFRVRPGETVEDVMAHVRATVADDRVEVRRLGGAGGDPSSVSATDSPAWFTLERTVHQVFTDVAVAPFIVLGGTDARHSRGFRRTSTGSLPSVTEVSGKGRVPTARTSASW